MTVDAPHRTQIPTRDGHFSGIPDELYHSDRGSLSVSGAKVLVQKGGPAKFREYMDAPRETKAEYDFGHLAHKIVLGEGADLTLLDPAVHGRTKDGKISSNPRGTADWKLADAAARAAGSVPVHINDYVIAEKMAAKVTAHPIAGPLFEHGHAEVSLYTRDAATGIRKRGRCDWLTRHPINGEDRAVIVDYKSAVSADEDVWTRTAADYGYHMQFWWYVALYVAVFGEMPVFLFVVQEKKSPYLVNVIELNGDAYELGGQQSRRALDLYAACMHANEWPGYTPKIHSGALPHWVFPRARSIGDAIAEFDLNDIDIERPAQ